MTQDKITNKKKELFDSLIAEKEKQIEFLKEKLRVAQEEQQNLVELHKQEITDKDNVMKEILKQAKLCKKETEKYNQDVNAFKALNETIIKSIETKAVELIDTGNKRIAIIEDDPDQAELILLRLEKFGYDIYIFSNVSEAAEYYLKGAFDLTLLDLNLENTGNVSGEQFIELLKKFVNKEDLGDIIVISGEDEERIKNAVDITGAVCYFKKPLVYTDLIIKIKEILK